MSRIITVFNNKGGVGKSTVCWNLADALARRGKRLLMIDFDPQCNLSIAVLGEEIFVRTLPTLNRPYGTTVRAFLQRFLQSTGGEEVFVHNGPHTHENALLIAGDFWLNVYADALNVGADLLTGTGLSRYVALRRIVDQANRQAQAPFDFVLVDLPPSFGALVRAAFYSSDYFIVPCTSDSFSVYCIGLIGQMVPSFIRDWQSGLARFRDSNPHFTDFDALGRPVFAGWVFNGFDTTRQRRSSLQVMSGAPLGDKKMVQADQTMHDRMAAAIKDDLVARLQTHIAGYTAVGKIPASNFRIGDIEDANVLVQNSLWLNVPISQLHRHYQVVDLQDRRNWAENQIQQIHLIGSKFDEMARDVEATCV